MDKDEQLDKKLFAVGLMQFLLLAGSSYAQQNQTATINTAQKSEIINHIIQLLNENYVFPETAQKMEVALREHVKKDEYAQINDQKAFADRLTADLQAVSHDLHLRVGFSPEVLPVEPDKSFVPSAEELERIRKQQQRENFGVAKVEILKGNIGLIQLNYFTNPNWVGEIYTAAMNYVANTDALILDLRNNGGSMHPDAIPFLCSYFFAEPVHLNDIYWRPEHFTRQFWTYPLVPGKRYLQKPIYVLISQRTFSGAEEIAYDLQNLKRATLIGQTTGGGAHGGGDRRLNDHFFVWIPIGRAINPISKTNWEGVGVKPDVEVASNKALYTAQLQAIGELGKTLTDEQAKQDLKNVAAEINKHLQKFKSVTFKLKGFETAQNVNLAGDFNGWSRANTRMSRNSDEWTTQFELEPGQYSYKFIVDGKWLVDPANPRTEGAGDTQNSVKEVN